ncbi:hypothetical protein OAV58_03105 [Gammaproteobacteria bacterium]|jgi:hypothetical protein|nr:hypothetical protein [Gammaproteobacteria bacterium]MDA8982304.1 hypothetical protein [Gammaproteobacteria bacterium]MDA9997408.1 hypothetical protein [Gammaproteobacteria bacterium]MDC3302113.1 hypothetical protein [Gammaproteobacteria bacterium]
MNNLIHINFNDSVIKELDNAVDLTSSKKTIAYKYFSGNLVELEKYLNKANYYNYNVSVSNTATQLELFS